MLINVCKMIELLMLYQITCQSLWRYPFAWIMLP